MTSHKLDYLLIVAISKQEIVTLCVCVCVCVFTVVEERKIGKQCTSWVTSKKGVAIPDLRSVVHFEHHWSPFKSLYCYNTNWDKKTVMISSERCVTIWFRSHAIYIISFIAIFWKSTREQKSEHWNSAVFLIGRV